MADSHSQYDAVVVGASVAGCSVATLLGRAGARVALVEQRPDPQAYKVMCTHYIQASATPTLQRLGLAQRIEAAGGVRNGFEMWSRFGWVRPPLAQDYAYPRYGYDIRREILDPMVREMAAQTPGVELLLGRTVTGLLGVGQRPEGVTVRTRDGAASDLHALVVIAADGRGSDVARIAGVKARVLPHDRFGYFAYYRDLPLVSGERSQMWLLDPDVAYAFPQDGGLTLLATFQSKDRMSWFKRDVEANFEAVFRDLPDAPDLSRGERVSKIMGKLELPNTMRPAGQPGLAFVGDAAMAADPVWGIGCGWAFQSAGWLADEIAGEFAATPSEAGVDAALERYRKRHRRELAGHYLVTSDYASARAFNPLERLLFSAAAQDEKCADGFAAFGARTIKPTDAAFGRLVARAVRVNARRRASVAPDRHGGIYAEGTPLPASVRSSRLRVGGIEVPVSSRGDDGASEAVVFVHGNPGPRRDWDDLLTRVPEGVRALAFDLPGFGQADKPDDFDYTVPGYARFLGAALDELGVQRAHLVMHDFGGPWGLQWASSDPGRLGSAVLINTGVLLDYSWHYLARVWRTPVVGEIFQAMTTRSGLRLALRHGNPRGLPRAYVDRMYDHSDAGANRAVLRLYRATSDPTAFGRRQADALAPYDLPALVVWGEADPYLPVALAPQQLEAFPSAQVEILPGSGHWPMIDNPEAVGRLVEPFLRAVIGTAPLRPAVLA